MMMMMRLGLFLVGSIMTTALMTDSIAGRQLLAQSRQLEDSQDFLGDYSVKFQGCHHVQQWNENVDNGNDVRIATKRLVRYRLCPTDSCSSDRSVGCTSKYGDYIVDLSTFVYNYLQGLQDLQESMCADAQELCNTQCGNNDDDCISTCYGAYDLSICLQGNNNNFDASQYAECTKVSFKNNNNNNNNNNNGQNYYYYYIGPYCSNQGGEIQLGVFTDDTCTTFAQNGGQLFYNAYRFELPYSSDSLVSTYCLNCGQADDNGDGQYEALDMCKNIYTMSGKCETRMSIDYPNESSCGYIEGIKIVRADGVIRTARTKQSKGAAVAIGVFMTASILLAGYVYYLRTKLSRAQINLASSGM